MPEAGECVGRKGQTGRGEKRKSGGGKIGGDSRKHRREAWGGRDCGMEKQDTAGTDFGLPPGRSLQGQDRMSRRGGQEAESVDRGLERLGG